MQQDQDQQQAVGGHPPSDVPHENEEEGEVQVQVLVGGQEQQHDPQQVKMQELELAFGQVPRSIRLPQPPSKQTIPDWVRDCYEKDEMAAHQTLHGSTLRTGVAPEVGMRLYLQLTFINDGSHPDDRPWARMMGEITHVDDPPEVGVYVKYEGQQQRLSDEELQHLRQELPALPPSLFGENAACSCCRSQQQVLKQYGAVHGQRIKARMWLSRMDLHKEPQLGPTQQGPGCWDIQLVCNDNLENMWVLCAMERAAAAELGGELPTQQHQPAKQQPQLRRQHLERQQERPQQQQDCERERQQPRQQYHQERPQQQGERPEDRRGWAGREQQQQQQQWEWEQQRGFKRERDPRERFEHERSHSYDREYERGGHEREHRDWKRREPSGSFVRTNR